MQWKKASQADLKVVETLEMKHPVSAGRPDAASTRIRGKVQGTQPRSKSETLVVLRTRKENRSLSKQQLERQTKRLKERQFA